MDFANRHIMVVGLGDSGLATVRWLAAHGATVSVADSRDNPPNLDVLAAELPGVRVRAGAFNDTLFDGVDLLVVSPGVALSTPAIAAYRARGGEVAGDIELFARAIAGGSARVIAISGSNGKSTVTMLAGHLCRSAGLDTVVAGNIGLPVLAALAEREVSGRMPDVWVLELSSFQLETTASLRADAATVLNISEDHLDRYNDLLDYAHAKTAVFNGHGVQVLNAEDPLVRAMVRPNHAVKWFALNDAAEYGLRQQDGRGELCLAGEAVFDLADLPLEGLHNAANALAALALCEGIGLARDRLLAGLKSFRGLPHRVELVNEFGGVKFIDDSKGTNVGATVAALNGMTRPVVLIAGGDGKGQDFTPLAPACRRIVRAVMLIGRDADKIRAALAGTGIALTDFATLEQATRAAAAEARSGDVVLLSPACASLDMFRNYAERARVFVDTVRAVQSEAGR
ncbi:MAG: UDP-N-acetylmuramoyl-L-alanine--D-glutamate ligase [Paludibacterium sp.]|uniref:UDP-N-acetylmuramoyl-L-alanine--D-glutamate ligase n=1 Tax=Paludibacterium sp. TaxID=1917523 RepID=UPI0025F320A1|nr:UDP-N-acetylmuramoyl-L-alanine--D-glutamate ligase [Paludibacterium sp.]MBV8048335.1 UDP-N-acetylmuramoyl-L-alanine--D-glutamate ligase [Paludibacterium sp.]MBV8649384.1 UDP-N-acetylmuramoyl-L-alanine--D-glutamate ligase [Paludibacterium sp.]